MWKFIRFIAVEIVVAFFTSEFFITIVGPLMVAAVIGLLGYLQEFPIPLPYLVASMAVGFGATATGVLRISEYRQRVTINGKLSFDRPTLTVTMAKDEKTIEKISIGFQLASSADFPIEFRVDELETELDNRVPVHKFKNSVAKEFEIPPRGSGFFRDGDIKFGEILEDKNVQGRVRFNVSYWRPGSKKRATVKKNINLVIGPGVGGQLLAIQHSETEE